MYRIRKSTFRRLVVASVAVMILAAVAVSTVVASGLTIVTQPVETQELTIDGTVVGTYPVYNGGQDLVVTYPAYSFPAGANGAYRLSVWQNATPLEASPTWVEIHINHHWASDPNPTSFTFGPFLRSENLCETCPSMVVVQPETFESYLDEGGVTQYRYTAISAAFTVGPAALTESDEVLFKGTAGRNSKSACGGDDCVSICESEILQFCAPDCVLSENPQLCIDECMSEEMPACVAECKAESQAQGESCGETCGNGFCDSNENPESCPADCSG